MRGAFISCELGLTCLSVSASIHPAVRRDQEASSGASAWFGKGSFCEICYSQPLTHSRCPRPRCHLRLHSELRDP